MLAYAANAPRHAERRSSPNAMLAVIAAHVAAIAALMSAKMDLPQRIFDPPTEVINVPLPPDPPPLPPQPAAPSTPKNSWVSHPNPQVPIPTPHSEVDTGGTTTFDPGVLTGGGTAAIPVMPPLKADPVRLGPQLLTPASELKPPYPHQKLLSEEEAVLKLRLTVDERGRVIAVDPVDRADPVFLKAARQHLVARWRYRPASEDGRTVSSSTVITLRFTLEG